jgi:hypothetical protein
MEVNSELIGFEELYEAHPSPFTIFHHQDHFSHSSFLVLWHSDDSHNLGYY